MIFLSEIESSRTFQKVETYQLPPELAIKFQIIEAEVIVEQSVGYELLQDFNKVLKVTPTQVEYNIGFRLLPDQHITTSIISRLQVTVVPKEGVTVYILIILLKE